MAGMTDIGRAENGLRNAAHGDHAAPAGELAQEGPGIVDLGACRAAVRLRPRREVRMCRHDVPAKRLLFQLELGEYAADDGGARLLRPSAGQLALRGERDPGDTRAAIARGLAHEEQ